MPGRRTHLTFAAAVAIGALLVAGCGGTENHTWQGEFTERLEGASAAVEAKRPELRSGSADDELRAGMELARTLQFKDELIAELDPPTGCEPVQRKGKAEVHGLEFLSTSLLQNQPPDVTRRLQVAYEIDLGNLGKLEHEAAECAAG